MFIDKKLSFEGFFYALLYTSKYYLRTLYSMRGSLSLFTDLLDSKVSASTVEKRKGRSADLIKARNECLVARYHFYLNFSEKRYNIIVELLSKEFFISTVTIPELLSENIELLEYFRKNKPDKTYFAKKYPHLKWS